MLLDGNRFMYTLGNWPPTVDGDGDGLLDTYAALQQWGFTYNGAMPRAHNDTLNMVMVDAHMERIELRTFLDPDADFWHDP